MEGDFKKVRILKKKTNIVKYINVLKILKKKNSFYIYLKLIR